MLTLKNVLFRFKFQQFNSSQKSYWRSLKLAVKVHPITGLFKCILNWIISRWDLNFSICKIIQPCEQRVLWGFLQFFLLTSPSRGKEKNSCIIWKFFFPFYIRTAVVTIRLQSCHFNLFLLSSVCVCYWIAAIHHPRGRVVFQFWIMDLLYHNSFLQRFTLSAQPLNTDPFWNSRLLDGISLLHPFLLLIASV